MQVHVLFGDDGNLRLSEIWDSREQLQAFGDRLMRILIDIGIEPPSGALVRGTDVDTAQRVTRF
jgi:hypothetical protein